LRQIVEGQYRDGFRPQLGLSLGAAVIDAVANGLEGRGDLAGALIALARLLPQTARDDPSQSRRYATRHWRRFAVEDSVAGGERGCTPEGEHTAGHLVEQYAEAPDVAGRAGVFTLQHLRRHVGQGAGNLTPRKWRPRSGRHIR